MARFAYALLLPAMKTDLGWDYAAAGAMNTANAAGYLVGAMLAPAIARAAGLRRTFAAGIALTAISVAASGLESSFAWLLLLRAAAGVTGAVAFVAGAGLASALAAHGDARRAPTILGLYFGGGGVGIVVSALAVPFALEHSGWRSGWYVLGALAAGATLIGAAAARRCPRQAPPRPTGAPGRWSVWAMALTLVAYFLFGAGYIAYVTFIVAWLRTEVGLSPGEVTAFWALLGTAAIVGAFVWGPVLGRLTGGLGAALTIGVTALGSAIPMVWVGRTGAYASAAVFGIAFLAVIAAVTAFARRAAPPQAWTTAIAVLTVAFGTGQTVGPLLTGVVMDRAQGLGAGLWISSGILVAAAGVAAFQREVRTA